MLKVLLLVLGISLVPDPKAYITSIKKEKNHYFITVKTQNLVNWRVIKLVKSGIPFEVEAKLKVFVKDFVLEFKEKHRLCEISKEELSKFNTWNFKLSANKIASGSVFIVSFRITTVYKTFDASLLWEGKIPFAKGVLP